MEKTLKKIDGISQVNVNLATEEVTFAHCGGDAELQKIARVVEEAGYKLHLPVPAMDEEKVAAESDVQESRQTRVYLKLKYDLIKSAALTLPVMIVSMLMMWLAFAATLPASEDTINKLLLILTSVVMFGPGKRFFKAAWGAAKHFSADMNTLVAVGTGAAYGYSALAVLFPHWLAISAAGGRHIYFDTAATIITLILFGRLLEARTKSKTSEAIKKLLGLQPKTARVLRNDSEVEIPVSEVILEDRFVVRSGEKIPVDGIIVSGKPQVKEIVAQNGTVPEQLLQWAASVENRSEHLLARAIVNYAREQNIAILDVQEFRSHTGLGVTAQINGMEVSVGRTAFLQDSGIDTSGMEELIEKLSAKGTTAITVAALGLLNPMFAAAAMALSSVSVVSNSLRLRRYRMQ